ncbi:bifunctional folylpolyglutamate synthase/dihydrofolate synthase [bacterium]|nr:MAG: bifunctional folylpolyglutamate synthase/dihydrofolate synthase [bacterium]
MTYVEAIQYLESFINYEKIPAFSYPESLKLERMKGFLALLGNPQEDLRCLHIAGTKGKGSVCAFAAYILKNSGFRVGLYTSPHLTDFRERIRILEMTHDACLSGPPAFSRAGRQARRARHGDFEGMISKREIAGLLQRFRPAIEKYNRNCKYGALTFFEVYTALAFLYFKRKKVDYAVLETGLGGRLDATNTVNPLVCAITPISYDHTDQLGNTLKKIAVEKAGIVKSGLPKVIIAPQEKEAREVIRNRCKETGAQLYEIGKDIVWRKKNDTGGFQGFSVKGVRGNYDNLKIGLLGEYQLGNAALAIGMVEALAEEKITALSIQRGLKEALWPGRLEVASRRPFIVLDGAHNTASAAALKEALKRHFKYKKLILVLGMSQDKDIEGVCDILARLAGKVILTKSGNSRAAEPEFIQKMLHRQAELTKNIKEAIAMAKKSANPRDLILITGSLFVAGEARICLKTY